LFGRNKEKKEKSASGSLLELVMIVAVALGLALGIQAFLVKPFRIPSESMVPTLEINQRVLVDRITPKLGNDYETGDIIVFKPPRGADLNTCGVNHPDNQACPEPTKEKSDTNFIKRIVGEPGDRLSVKQGYVYIDGEKQDESFVRPSADCATCNLEKPITIPPDHYFMMGDNRGESADSREWGPVPEKWIIGNAFATYWPPRKIGGL
jgi:signal peptidase I